MTPEYITKTLPSNFDEMVAAMLRCEQTKGQSVYQHGQSVCKYFLHLLDHINGGYSLDGWKLPDWFAGYADDLVSNIHDESIIREYTLYHDCGKPFCESDGRFPNHVEASTYVWSLVGGNEIVRRLIANDMVFHTATAEEIKHKMENEWSIKDACTLYLAALSEIHSNAKMFGGIESQSFKIKWKQLERRGKQICKHYFGILEVLK